LLLCFGLAGCGPAIWRQAHRDAANTGTLVVGTQPAAMGTALTGVLPPIGDASPVIAPDGSVYIASWERGTGGAGDLGHGAVWRIAGKGTPSITGNSGVLPGQLSTAAVDAAGNIYVAQYLTFNHGAPQSALLRWDSTFANMKSVRINGVALSAPKVLDGTGQSPLIVQTYTTEIGAHHVLILNDQLTPLADWETCVPDQPSIWDNFRIGFHIRGIDLGPPYFESASVGIRSIDSARGNTFYLVAAGDGCGVTFYTIDPTLANPKVLTYIAHHGPNAALLTSPAISADGIAVIADADHHITAYDITTGDQKWQSTTTGFISATPVMAPGALNVVYAATYSEVLKLELATGMVLNATSVTGTSTDATPAAGGNLLFVATSAGLFTFRLSDLGFLAAAPFPGGASSPAIGRDGYVIVPTTDGRMLRFPGP
jgi:outer membrane protein assembly factor BamB